jgi:hypothetical protein
MEFLPPKERTVASFEKEAALAPSRIKYLFSVHQNVAAGDKTQHVTNNTQIRTSHITSLQQ